MRSADVFERGLSGVLNELLTELFVKRLNDDVKNTCKMKMLVLMAADGQIANQWDLRLFQSYFNVLIFSPKCLIALFRAITNLPPVWDIYFRWNRHNVEWTNQWLIIFRMRQSMGKQNGLSFETNVPSVDLELTSCEFRVQYLIHSLPTVSCIHGHDIMHSNRAQFHARTTSTDCYVAWY